MDWVDDVVRFWFDELRPKDWWHASPTLDERIRVRFGALHDRLSRDLPDLQTLDATGHLATTIVLDQFSRNLHRGSVAAFAADPLALSVALHAIAGGLDRALVARRRHFLYMPLMHSEDPAMQARSLALFASLGDPRALHSARGHHDIIARFGRFPARNAALGRASSDVERAFLARHSTVD